jgi:hypothetical protein
VYAAPKAATYLDSGYHDDGWTESGVTQTIYGNIPNMTPAQSASLTAQQQAFSNNGFD